MGVDFKADSKKNLILGTKNYYNVAVIHIYYDRAASIAQQEALVMYAWILSGGYRSDSFHAKTTDGVWNCLLPGCSKSLLSVLML